MTKIKVLFKKMLRFFNQPKYKDCPNCGATIPARRSICPSCASYLPS